MQFKFFFDIIPLMAGVPKETLTSYEKLFDELGISTRVESNSEIAALIRKSIREFVEDSKNTRPLSESYLERMYLMNSELQTFFEMYSLKSSKLLFKRDKADPWKRTRFDQIVDSEIATLVWSNPGHHFVSRYVITRDYWGEYMASLLPSRQTFYEQP